MRKEAVDLKKNQNRLIHYGSKQDRSEKFAFCSFSLSQLGLKNDNCFIRSHALLLPVLNKICKSCKTEWGCFLLIMRQHISLCYLTYFPWIPWKHVKHVFKHMLKYLFLNKATIHSLLYSSIQMVLYLVCLWCSCCHTIWN